MCIVDMTELLADIKVQVNVTEMADRRNVISKGFYMVQNSKYKNGGLVIYFLSLCPSARTVWAQSEHVCQGWGTVFSVHSYTQDSVILLLSL